MKNSLFGQEIIYFKVKSKEKIYIVKVKKKIAICKLKNKLSTTF